jgi:hypothetical protein
MNTDRVIGSRPFTDGAERTAYEDAHGRQFVVGNDAEVVYGQWRPPADEPVVVEGRCATMTPDIPESAVRLTATGTGLEFLMDRHAYLVLDEAARSEMLPGRAPPAERPATADEAGRLADFIEGDTPARGRLTSAAPDFFGGPAAAARAAAPDLSPPLAEVTAGGVDPNGSPERPRRNSRTPS